MTACFVVVDDAEIARNGGDLGLRGRLLALDLVAHGVDRLGIGADEDDAGLRQRLGKGLALGQKAVARMHRLGAGLLAGVDDLVDDEIGLGGGRRADRHGLVGHFDVQRVAIGVGIDRDGFECPMRRAVLMMRQAISPRLAIRIRLNMPRLDPAKPAF